MCAVGNITVKSYVLKQYSYGACTCGSLDQRKMIYKMIVKFVFLVFNILSYLTKLLKKHPIDFFSFFTGCLYQSAMCQKGNEWCYDGTLRLDSIFFLFAFQKKKYM